MIKCLIALVLIVFLISEISAIRINEVELNPLGDDAGNEWIELYNNGEISLEGYMIVNSDGENISLNDTFNGYFVYTFAKQWLDNSNENISLYKNSELIDKTDLFNDSKNNDLTWQFCSGSWKFLNSTKGAENNCPEEITQTTNNFSNETPYTANNSQTINTKSTVTANSITENPSENVQNNVNLTPIALNIKSENNNENSGKNWALGGILTFCVLFGTLFLLKTLRKENKNEFR